MREHVFRSPAVAGGVACNNSTMAKYLLTKACRTQLDRLRGMLFSNVCPATPTSC
jgi:hypothetical protein